MPDSARGWWAVHHRETHQNPEDPEEYTGKTAYSKHAFCMAEMYEYNGIWDSESERSYGDYPEEDDEYEYPDDPEEHEDHEDPEDPEDDDGFDHGEWELNYPMTDIWEWEGFVEHLDARYHDRTDLADVRMFYHELSEECNFRTEHKHLMVRVFNQMFVRFGKSAKSSQPAKSAQLSEAKFEEPVVAPKDVVSPPTPVKPITKFLVSVELPMPKKLTYPESSSPTVYSTEADDEYDEEEFGVYASDSTDEYESHAPKTKPSLSFKTGPIKVKAEKASKGTTGKFQKMQANRDRRLEKVMAISAF